MSVHNKFCSTNQWLTVSISLGVWILFLHKPRLPILTKPTYYFETLLAATTCKSNHGKIKAKKNAHSTSQEPFSLSVLLPFCFGWKKRKRKNGNKSGQSISVLLLQLCVWKKLSHTLRWDRATPVGIRKGEFSCANSHTFLRLFIAEEMESRLFQPLLYNTIYMHEWDGNQAKTLYGDKKWTGSLHSLVMLRWVRLRSGHLHASLRKKEHCSSRHNFRYTIDAFLALSMCSVHIHPLRKSEREREREREREEIVRDTESDLSFSILHGASSHHVAPLCSRIISFSRWKSLSFPLFFCKCDSCQWVSLFLASFL